MGIFPDIIIARTDEPLDEKIKDKISLFCNVDRDCVIENLTLSSIYEAPVMLHESGLDEVVCRKLKLKTGEPDMAEWNNMIHKIKNADREVVIAIAGKYVKLHDAYLSIMESLNHAGFHTGSRVSIRWIESQDITPENVSQQLKGVDGIIIPGSFGDRGIEGKIIVCRYARENNIPFLGICLGMQIAVIEFASNVCGLKDAHSSEFANTPHPVIDLMEGQVGVTNKGGTMRLGAYPCKIAEGTMLKRLYNTDLISERHRHRYEFNNAYRDTITEHGMAVSGTSPDGKLVEAVELPQNRFFVGVQYHPEFKSRPNRPHPLFVGLLKAALEENQ